MKPTAIVTAAVDIVKGPYFVKISAVALLSLSLFALFYHLPSIPSAVSYASTSAVGGVNTSISPYISPQPSPSPTTGSSSNSSRRRQPPPWVTEAPRIGIVDETGAMTVEFDIGEFDSSAMEELRNLSDWREEEKKEENNDSGVRVRYEKYKVCEETKSEYIPCLDNVEEITRLNLSGSVERFQRHCPEVGKWLDCLVPMPKGYKRSISWPKSRDEVWFSNVPRIRLVKDKNGQNWIARKGDKLIFPRGGRQFIHGVDEYLNQISQMVPAIAFGQHTRVALDIGCGIASFGAFLLQRNVITLSIALKDAHENQIQFALERGVPAMAAAFASRRLLTLLVVCWELVKKEGSIAIWQKPLNNSCYLNRDAGAQPPLCDSNDDPDNVWYISLRACINLLPENGYGANVITWPMRLHYPPDRLQIITMDASISRKEIFKAESKYWNDIIESYVRAFRWKQMNFRNVMDMRAGFGGFAAALHDLQIDCWVMNVVPVSGFNTLPVIYDRGLIGVMHDWCEPFDTYPRTYDLLHAAGLFSVEQKRDKCNISTIMLEMDRILRPGGIVYVRDSVSVMDELQEIAKAMGWVPFLRDTGEGEHASWKILICEKRMP
ncbi:hypothetical protein GH714_022823 [Hevea brasiliensis]|uniref:Methyltransferase n=1 Tax=Hevea brasiliensis TaxID=3981 RepID=A0A6A6KRR7_HEVBR|nr:hypothetical protein GH714_022823 [Hevea brasiliensis]